MHNECNYCYVRNGPGIKQFEMSISCVKQCSLSDFCKNKNGNNYMLTFHVLELNFNAPDQGVTWQCIIRLSDSCTDIDQHSQHPSQPDWLWLWYQYNLSSFISDTLHTYTHEQDAWQLHSHMGTWLSICLLIVMFGFTQFFYASQTSVVETNWINKCTFLKSEVPLILFIWNSQYFSCIFDIDFIFPISSVVYQFRPSQTYSLAQSCINIEIAGLTKNPIIIQFLLVMWHFSLQYQTDLLFAIAKWTIAHRNIYS